MWKLFRRREPARWVQINGDVWLYVRGDSVLAEIEWNCSYWVRGVCQRGLEPFASVEAAKAYAEHRYGK